MTAARRAADGPRVRLEPAESLVFGSFVDCNMASAWVGGRLRVFPGKYGEDPVWGPARDLKFADAVDAPAVFAKRPEDFTEPALPPIAPPGRPGLHGAIWLETVYQDPADPSGLTLHGLYHNENYPATLPHDPVTGEGYVDDQWPLGLKGAGSPQAVCRIGIMASRDGGLTWADRGIVLEDKQPRLIVGAVNGNHTFPGGTGDPSAVPCGDHLYVFYGEYGYPGVFAPETYDPRREACGQCVSVARIALADLDGPVGRARRWDGVAFAAPGDGIGVPISSLRIPPEAGGGPVSNGRHSFYWGPSVSWNDHLDCWVMLLARVDGPFWSGDSIWISFNRHADLGRGAASQDWSPPVLLLRRPGHTLWYPSLQPLGGPDEVAARHTSTRLGRRARLWVKDRNSTAGFDQAVPDERHVYCSDHKVVFEKSGVWEDQR